LGKASKVSVGTHDSDEVGHAFNSSLFGFGVGFVARRLSEAARNVGEGRALGHGGRARGRVGGRQTALRRRRDPIFAEGLGLGLGLLTLTLFRSPCLITLTAHCRMPACPNLRVNWNRKLEQMLFSQNPFREPIF